MPIVIASKAVLLLDYCVLNAGVYGGRSELVGNSDIQFIEVSQEMRICNYFSVLDNFML